MKIIDMTDEITMGTGSSPEKYWLKFKRFPYRRMSAIRLKLKYKEQRF
jgi:hypothetical protein